MKDLYVALSAAYLILCVAWLVSFIEAKDPVSAAVSFGWFVMSVSLAAQVKRQ